MPFSRFARRAQWRSYIEPLYRFGARLPPVLRSFVGLLFCIGGVLGFLPILGFWMLPLGMLFIALDIPPLRRHAESWFDSWS